MHSDYRDHAQSDADPHGNLRPRTGYTEDVINAVVALTKANLPSIDVNRIGMMGHSMGGGIALNVMVTKPDLVQAYVLYAPISPEYRDGFDRYVLAEQDDIAQEFLDTYGTPEEAPDYWASISAINYFDDVTAPIMLHHGTADKDVPLSWSAKTQAALEEAGKNFVYHEYPGEGHEFGLQWSTFMKRSLEFFNTNL